MSPRSGHRWFASVLCKITVNRPDKPSRRQRTNGTIGVDIGVIHAMAFSKPVDLKDGKGPRDVVDILAELRDMRTTQTEVSTVDQLAQRRAARLAAAQDRGDTAVRVHTRAT